MAPYVPRSSINAAEQSELMEEEEKEETLPPLTPGEQRQWGDWSFFSRELFKQELVQYQVRSKYTSGRCNTPLQQGSSGSGQ